MSKTTKKIIITGCPRSGTGYMAEVLTRSGLQCGHENVFDLECKPFTIQADSSWLAAPRLFAHGRDYVVHLTRHPLLVIESLLRIGFWHHAASRPYRKFVIQYTGKLSCSPLMQSMYLWVSWSTMAETYADKRLKVETLTAKDIAGILRTAGVQPDIGKVSAALLNVPRNWNTKDRGFGSGPLTAGALQAANSALYDTMRTMAEGYGYELGC
jgi:hypothetical protein